MSTDIRPRRVSQPHDDNKPLVQNHGAWANDNSLQVNGIMQSHVHQSGSRLDQSVETVQEQIINQTCNFALITWAGLPNPGIFTTKSTLSPIILIYTFGLIVHR